MQVFLDFRLEKINSMYLLTPLSLRAKDWAAKYAERDAKIRREKAYTIPELYLGVVVDALKAAGFNVEIHSEGGGK